MMEKETARNFWVTQDKYPNYGTIKQRRLYELNYIVPKLKNFKTLLDLGCGDGSLVKCLHELTDIETFYAFDIAEKMMKDIPAITGYYDCYNPKDLPQTDVTIFSGVIPFLFEDDIVHMNLEKIKSEFIYIKSPCSMEVSNISVDTYSEQLNSYYSSIYRTIPDMIKIINKHFKILEVNKIYPDEIESKFGTKQIAFICKI
jgi:hypothetical protein